MTDEILRGMDRSHITLLTLLDLSRCFDVIDHDTLLEKLQLMGISTGWFKSYLEGHVQQVKVGDVYSKPLPINSGTFQGTCLGPLLFNIASNDLACHIPDQINGFQVTVVRYADDTQIAVTGPREKISEIKASISSILDTVATWFLQHGMKVNGAKTEFIVCGDTRQLQRIKDPPSSSFMGAIIQSSKFVKNLGVYMYETLSWDHHIKTIVSRCVGILIGLANVKHVLPIELLPRIIDSLVLSHVRYCIQVYGSANKTSLKSLQKILNFSARIISGRRKNDDISDVLHKLNWPNVEQLVQQSDQELLNKIIANQNPPSLASLIRFNHNILPRTTRQSNHISLPHPKNNHGKRSFMYRSGQCFNLALAWRTAHLSNYAYIYICYTLYQSLFRCGCMLHVCMYMYLFSGVCKWPKNNPCMWSAHLCKYKYKYFYIRQRWRSSARAHVRTRFPYQWETQ